VGLVKGSKNVALKRKADMCESLVMTSSNHAIDPCINKGVKGGWTGKRMSLAQKRKHTSG
jgi:hypothetical protein